MYTSIKQFSSPHLIQFELISDFMLFLLHYIFFPIKNCYYTSFSIDCYQYGIIHSLLSDTRILILRIKVNPSFCNCYDIKCFFTSEWPQFLHLISFISFIYIENTKGISACYLNIGWGLCFYLICTYITTFIIYLNMFYLILALY